jgi:lipopolysaccharide biosynthesis protein
MKRLLVFAHWDKDNIVDDYVLCNLQGFREFAHRVIFVSDSDLPESQICRLDGLVDEVIAGRHGEYDFGSYKRGYLAAQEQGILYGFDELIFANDTTFGPLFPCGDAVDRMSAADCDFWGITVFKSSLRYSPEKGVYNSVESNHIQSYFSVYKKNVFTGAFFDLLVKSVSKEENKGHVVVKYEFGFSNALTEAGYKMGWLSARNAMYIENFRYKKRSMPFLKTTVLKNIAGTRFLDLWLARNAKYWDYPAEVIAAYLRRFPAKGTNGKAWRKWFIRINPPRGRIVFMGRAFFPFKNTSGLVKIKQGGKVG